MTGPSEVDTLSRVKKKKKKIKIYPETVQYSETHKKKKKSCRRSNRERPSEKKKIIKNV